MCDSLTNLRKACGIKNVLRLKEGAINVCSKIKVEGNGPSEERIRQRLVTEAHANLDLDGLPL